MLPADQGVIVQELSSPPLFRVSSHRRLLRAGLWLVLTALLLTTGPVSVEDAVPSAPVSPTAGGGWAAEKWGDPLTDANAKDKKAKNAPDQDAGSLATVTTVIGARALWKQTDATGRAITGQGVTVA